MLIWIKIYAKTVNNLYKIVKFAVMKLLVKYVMILIIQQINNLFVLKIVLATKVKFANNSNLFF